MQCTAHSKNTGKRCGSHAIKGGNVCRMHGGDAPQVKRKAAERLAEARDEALALLVKQIKAGEVEPSVALQAVVKLTETTETLEGRVARREERVNVEQSELDREIERLLEGLAAGSEAAPVRAAAR